MKDMFGDKTLKLKDSNKVKLKNSRLETSPNTSRNLITISKPDSVEGNTIPLINMPYEEDGLTSFSPRLELEKHNGKWLVRHWEYIPGPGPGDFSLDFDLEDDAIDFIISYYFTDNKYFIAKKVEILQHRKGFEIVELKSIFEKALNKLKEQFSINDFVPFETNFYNKLTIENWKNLDPQIETPKDVKVECGFLLYDCNVLKDLITQNRSFEPDDFERISEVFKELSNITRRAITSKKSDND